jgi:hypothetical protein
MRRFGARLRWTAVRLALACGLALAGAAPAAGQFPDRMQFGLGYAGNAPDAMGGVSAYAIWPKFGGLGIYVDTKWDIDSPEKDRAFDPTRTKTTVESELTGAQFLNSEDSFRTFNIALLRPMSPSLMLYAGGGLARAKAYYLYNVPAQGDIDDALLVAAPDQDEDRVNLMAGMILRLSPVLSSQFGFESEPSGVTIGVSFRLPRW